MLPLVMPEGREQMDVTGVEPVSNQVVYNQIV